MSAIGPANSSVSIITDDAAFGVADPSGFLLAGPRAMWTVQRLEWALPLNAGQGGLTKRYHPDKPPAEVCVFGLDFSFLIPYGVGISSGSLDIRTNTATPEEASSDWVIGPTGVRGRAIYALLGGGAPGCDYQLRWTAVDSGGNVWPRTVMCLVAETS